MRPKALLKRLLPPAILSWYHLLLSQAAAVIYGFPSRKLIVIGVTGTKGKSTTTNLIAQLLESLGQKVGLTSTINFKIGRQEWLNDKKMTMLGRWETQRYLRRMVAAGCRYAVIETSSEGILQWRHRGIEYDVAVFTNLSPEHLEAHGGYDNYREAKERLFAHLTRFKPKSIAGRRINKCSVVNGDDREAQRFLSYPADIKKTFGTLGGVDYAISNIRLTDTGADFRLNDIDLTIKLLGKFNVMNAVAAVATTATLGFDPASMRSAVAGLKPLPGRQEFIDCGQPFAIMVDYAYEPESQGQLYELLAGLEKNRLIHVTGSTGGGRDQSRRPLLGKLAGQKADIVIVTNEDPYDEDPQTIVDQVAAGAVASGKRPGENLFSILDRRQAIHTALRHAKTGDLVLITGKGSEQAMCVAGGKKIPWDDRQVVKDYFKQLA